MPPRRSQWPQLTCLCPAPPSHRNLCPGPLARRHCRHHALHPRQDQRRLHLPCHRLPAGPARGPQSALQVGPVPPALRPPLRALHPRADRRLLRQPLGPRVEQHRPTCRGRPPLTNSTGLPPRSAASPRRSDRPSVRGYQASVRAPVRQLPSGCQDNTGCRVDQASRRPVAVRRGANTGLDTLQCLQRAARERSPPSDTCCCH